MKLKNYTSLIFTLLISVSTTFLMARSMITQKDLANIDTNTEYLHHLHTLSWELFLIPRSGVVSVVTTWGKTEEEGHGARVFKASLLGQQGKNYKKNSKNSSPEGIAIANEVLRRFDEQCENHPNLTRAQQAALVNWIVHQIQLEKNNLSSEISYKQFADYVENKQVDINKVSEILFYGLAAKFLLGLPD